ncbi:M23 family metallopeptidase [Stomatohabitans albus]|uniref:murein hydrolase activator EnvC family protein n=1 Tax=Stomatohabitans albus TaxID=3110766 RepID=UPI00300C0526
MYSQHISREVFRLWAAISVVLVGWLVPQGALARPISYVRPVPGTVVQTLAEPKQPWTSGHRGVDLAATPGESVHAMRRGTIVFAGMVAGVGWVTIDHGGDLSTTYGPIAMPSAVRVGQVVHAGTVIGVVAPGQSHLDVGARVPHPTWRTHYRYLDPLSLEQQWIIRLKPA